MMSLYDTGEFYFTVFLVTVFFVMLIVIIYSSLSSYYSRRRTHEIEVVKLEHTLLQTRLEIQEQTFRSISQEIHDNLGQVLSLVKLQLNTLNLERPQQAKEKISESVDLISQTIQSLRTLARNMHSESIKLSGLIPALESEIRMIEKLGIMQPVFQVYGSPVLVEEDKSLIIFRIVQEALHNVIKHSKATLVEMYIHYSPDNMKLTVKDNGTGFSGPGSSDGSGLRNMRDRARVIGADFSIDSTEARGTLITLTIPQS